MNAPSDPESAAFWDAAAKHVFLIRRCNACSHAHWYPRAICPHCFSTDVVWLPASGDGEIYSYSVMRRAKTPYVVAYVRLAEGPIMLTNIVECDVDAVGIGDAVRILFTGRQDAPPIPTFRPAPRGRA